MNFLNRLRQLNMAAVAQVNPFDNGQTYRSKLDDIDTNKQRYENRQQIDQRKSKQPKYPAEAKYAIPTGSEPVPYYNDKGAIEDFPLNSSLIESNDGGTFYDRTGGLNKTNYPDSHYLRIAPYFPELKKIEPKQQINRLKGLIQ